MHKGEFLLPLERFILKVLKNFGIATLLVTGSLGIGAVGYHVTEGMRWLDAALNASMILTGMGPVTELQTDAGKTFAIFYSLFSGVVFLTVAAVVFAPLVHRLLKRFHLDTKEDK